jgi:hypothetical protein
MASEDVGETNHIFPKIDFHTGEVCHIVFYFPLGVYCFLLSEETLRQSMSKTMPCCRRRRSKTVLISLGTHSSSFIVFPEHTSFETKPQLTEEIP